MNGFKTVEYDWASDAFLEVVKGSKFAKKEYAEFGPFGTAEKVISFCRITGTKSLSGISRLENLNS